MRESPYTERLQRKLEELDEMKEYTIEIKEKMEEEDVGFDDDVLIEKNDIDAPHIGVIGKLQGRPNIITDQNNNFSICFPLSGTEEIGRMGRGGYKIMNRDVPPSTLAKPGDDVCFQEDSIQRLQDKYNIHL